MPLPTPKQSDTKRVFIERCLKNPTVKREFKTQGQRLAVCVRQWLKKEKEVVNE